MSKEPARTDNVEAHLRYPKILENGTKVAGIHQNATLPGEVTVVAGESFGVIDYRAKVAELKARGIKRDWKVSVVLEYSVLPEAGTPDED